MNRKRCHAPAQPVLTKTSDPTTISSNRSEHSSQISLEMLCLTKCCVDAGQSVDLSIVHELRLRPQLHLRAGQWHWVRAWLALVRDRSSRSQWHPIRSGQPSDGVGIVHVRCRLLVRCTMYIVHQVVHRIHRKTPVGSPVGLWVSPSRAYVCVRALIRGVQGFLLWRYDFLDRSRSMFKNMLIRCAQGFSLGN